jgi:hypothetical protein
MRTRIVTLTVLVLLFVLPVALHAQGTDPAAVVIASVEPLSRGDMDAVMAYWADDAVMEVVHLDATYTGAAEIRALFEGLLAQNFEMHIAEVLQVEGDTVTTRTSMGTDDTRGLGVPIESTQVYTVQDGKITALTCSWSEESLAALQAAVEAAAETLPETGGDPFAIRALLMSLSGLTVLGGGTLGLELRRRRSRGHA